LAIVNFGMILSRLPQLSLQERLVSVAGRYNTRPLREECGPEGDGIGLRRLATPACQSALTNLTPHCLTQNVTGQLLAVDWDGATESVRGLYGGKDQHGRAA
jgi:hypothetical protein